MAPTGSAEPTITAFPTYYDGDPTFQPTPPPAQFPVSDGTSESLESPLSGGAIFGIIVALAVVSVAAYCYVKSSRSRDQDTVIRQRRRPPMDSELELAETVGDRPPNDHPPGPLEDTGERENELI